MNRSHTRGRGRAARAEGEGAAARNEPEAILLKAVAFRSAHGLLKACSEDIGWKNGGEGCPAPAWTRARHGPVSHTLGDPIQLELTLNIPDRAEGDPPISIHGEGPGGLYLAPDEEPPAQRGTVDVRSKGPLARRIAKLRFAVRWYEGDGEALSPRRTENVVYATLGRPRDDQQEVYPEDGVTLKRMDRAVAWVAPLRTLCPHTIVRALMGKFPFYALHPSSEVPRRYHHPTYFNQEGGAWPMSDYAGESGECQAIVRLVRGILRQLGVPGEARTVLVWGDPEVDGGRTAVSAYWEDDPGAGLDRTKLVNGRRWFATLVDGPVEVGEVYPPSHTSRPEGLSPGFNRYEACLEFTHGDKKLDYGGGAGVFQAREDVLRAFWGLVWVSEAPPHGFRVEEIVTRY